MFPADRKPRNERDRKRRLGQYMTPPDLARRIIRGLSFEGVTRILEPSCGNGSFLAAASERLQALGRESGVRMLGVEIDPRLAERCRTRLAHCPGIQVRECDFLSAHLAMLEGGPIFEASADLQPESFDLIIGNPPFGGSFDRRIEDRLDAALGRRFGLKIKKETYAFFVVACVDLLRPGGRLAFICSDSLMTISTMKGLRSLLMRSGSVHVRRLDRFSGETDYPMVVLEFTKGLKAGLVKIDSTVVGKRLIRATPNLSWGVTPELGRLFEGPSMGDFMVGTGGMTIGRNEWFVRPIGPGGRVIEPFKFEFVQEPVTVEYEQARARHGKLPERRRAELEAAERAGATERRLRVTRRPTPLIVQWPDDRYRPYNKATSLLLHAEPSHCVFWERDGEALLTFKKTAHWHLRGIGGQPYFGREGLTWSLTGPRFQIRRLPPGFILDSGAPCAFLREGVAAEHLLLALAWLLSPLAQRTLKGVINHTRNIQGKDFERMPHPWWLNEARRSRAIELVAGMLAEAQAGRRWRGDEDEMRRLGDLFEF